MRSGTGGRGLRGTEGGRLPPGVVWCREVVGGRGAPFEVGELLWVPDSGDSM